MNLRDRVSGWRNKVPGGGIKDFGFWVIRIVLTFLFVLIYDRIINLFFGFSLLGELGIPIVEFIWDFGYIVVLIILIIAILYTIGRAETRRRAFTLIKGGFYKRLNAILRRTKIKRDTPEGREPQIFRENRLLFHALANYTTRSEITFRYWAIVKTSIKVGEKLAPVISKFNNPEILRKDIIAYRSGGIESENNEHVSGWNRLNLEVVNLMNELIETTVKTYFAGLYRLKLTGEFKREAAQFEDLQRRARELKDAIDTDLGKYKLRTGAYRAHHILKAYREVVLNMSNVTGDVKQHPLKFARPGARFRGDTGYYGPPFEAGKDSRGHPIHEVNQYGEFMDDINAMNGGNENVKPRILENPRDIIDYPDFIELMRTISLDWKYLAEDIRYGLYHPKSRTMNLYISGLSKKLYPEWADKHIKFTNSPNFNDPALDMHALADTGLNPYWGREKTFDTDPSRKNPYPVLSSLGLRDYLRIRVETDMRNKDLQKRFLMKYPADTGMEKIMEGEEVKQKVGMYLGQEVTEAGGGGGAQYVEFPTERARRSAGGAGRYDRRAA